MNFPLTSDPLIGRLIGDRQRYRLEQRLGAGGMGDVFLAMDTLLGKQVALKLLKDTLVGSGELRKRFEREVALCGALKSDHIVEVSDYGVTPEGNPFYVMEYLSGQTLGQLLRQQQRLSVERTVDIITQVCEGLLLAHAGVTLWRDSATASERVVVIHRDLKPDNIFLVNKGLKELVKILDFGIAKIYNNSPEHTNLTRTSMFMGTFHYASPEQLEVEIDLDRRADIYSLGIILYEMLSGTDPFGLGLNINYISEMSWALAHSAKLPVPLRLQPGCEQLSPELEAVVMRCLQKSPGARFASVDELKWALLAAVSVPQKEGEESYNAPPAVSHQRKVPLILTGAGMAIAITLTGGIAYLNKRPSVEMNTALDKITALQVAANYDLCITEARKVTVNSSLYFKAQELLNQCQLEQAKKLAEAGNFAAAITAATTIASTMPQDSPLYQEAQNLVAQWSNSIINLASAQFQAGKLNQAIAQVQTIPATSPAHQKALQAIAQWKNDWQVAETKSGAAKNALDRGKWQVAIDESNQVPNISYWKQKIKPVVQEAQAQIVKAEAAKVKAKAKAEIEAAAPQISQSQLQKPTGGASIPEPTYSVPTYSEPTYSVPTYSLPRRSVPTYSAPPSYSAPRHSTRRHSTPSHLASSHPNSTYSLPPAEKGWEDAPTNNSQSGDI